MRTKTVKAKITIWFSVLFFALVAAVLVLLLAVGQSALKTNTKEKLRILVEANTEELEYLDDDEELGDDDGDQFLAFRGGYLEIDDDFSAYLEGMYVCVYEENEFLYGENPIEAYPDKLPLKHETLQEMKYEGETYFIYDCRVQGENLDGIWIRGIASENEGTPMLLKLIRAMVFALPLLAFLAVFGGYWITRRALKPLDDICDQAELINGGSDLTRRIEIRNESAETRRLADTFNQMFERLYTSFESEKQFTSDVSHELRTPIAVILAECEYALGETEEAEWREALEVIGRQGNRMSELVEELLTFSRMDRGTLKLQMRRLNLTELVGEVCREQARIRREDIKLHLELEPDVQAEGDEKLLARMVANLVVNAYKYGREPGNVWVRLYHENGRAALSVRDDGIGIRKEELDLIWNRFYRADNARNDSSSAGLGLSMVREIARLHRAEIKVFSEIQKGSVFLILF